jgi:hypothetical protein
MITVELTTKQAIELWYHYEEIAMHFNSLIIQYRLQLMGGIGAIGTIAGYLIGEKMKDFSRQRDVKLFVSVMIFFLLLSAALLDIFYYSELLEGSVKTLLEFEAKYPFINMSTNISTYMGWNKHLICICYAFVLMPLLGFIVYSWREKPKDTKNDEPIDR